MEIRWPKRIENIIFDMDGTLVDTEKLYNRFWVEAAQYYGYPMEPRHALMLRSLTASLAEPLMQKEVCQDFDYHKVRERRRKIMEEYVDEYGLDPKPGLFEALPRISRCGIRIALATATQEWRARKYLLKLGVLQYFDIIATAEMVEHGKPAPDIYLYAMERLGSIPEVCAAVEDSPTGILSAKASGAFTVMIPDMDEPDAETRKHCDMVLPTLVELADLVEGRTVHVE